MARGRRALMFWLLLEEFGCGCRVYRVSGLGFRV